ncbi:hypothetical protein FSP39_022329 [Pinctada imbricata]|uniref:Galactosylgalactosylxylosylprotein 3-beta-glucuronosyltransferase n=1 Tax=Pinctada imbricata TaxID=66713 RepID=A0AA88XDZ6_PINIB|nr:hypothetical protein FSP39_022329 [Pinctada imbricata]
MRSTKKVSCWPVGLNVEKIVVTNGSVIGFSNIQTKYDRTFPLDMAGFAFNVRVLFEHPSLKFHSNVRDGYQETKFLEQFCTIGDLEPKADNCKKVRKR